MKSINFHENSLRKRKRFILKEKKMEMKIKERLRVFWVVYFIGERDDTESIIETMGGI